uniref:hypothetical protein n=1 Tax=Hericium alpestre TaxID=135208 RepID=UPI0024355CC4|nr:hypothetical protein QEO35_mgp40 [Hericium alpestre]WEX31993.1 hypothetical protein [Hericium alpestre]
MFEIQNNILDILTLIHFYFIININLIYYIFIISVITAIPIILFSKKRLAERVINGVIYGGAAGSAYSGGSQTYKDYINSKSSSNNNNGGSSSNNDNNNNNNNKTENNQNKTEANKKSIYFFNKPNKNIGKYLYSANLIPFFNFDWSAGPENMSGFQQLFFGILGFAIVLLWCFINVIGYFVVLYLINYTDLENKLGKYHFIIKYYKKITFFSIIIDIIFIFVTLLTIIGLCIIIVYQ